MSSEQESHRPDMNTESPTSHAFEYVAGTLRGDARQQFEQQLQQQPELADEVRLWEQELMNLNQTTPERQPDERTWEVIEAAIKTSETVETEQPSKRNLWHRTYQTWQRIYQRWQSGFVLFRPGALAFVWALLVTVWLVSAPLNPSAFTPDYVAVLTQPDSDQPLLTALTSSDTSELRLQWREPPAHQQPIPADASWQLWARSRRDGQVRSVLIFDHQHDSRLALDQARLRLIRDAEDLILTLEEAGGSPIDEPSDQLLARGACVRLTLESS